MRAESSTPAIPKTRDFGNPLTRRATWTMASSGLVTRIRMTLGDRDTNAETTDFTILAFVVNNSSRLIPDLRGIPEVITATDEPAVSS